MSWFNGKSKTIPMPDLSEQAIAEKENVNGTWYTPDVNFLEQHPFQTLFLWGRDQPSWPFYDEYIEPFIECPPVTAFTVDHFTVYEKNVDGDAFLVALEEMFYAVPHCCLKGKAVTISSPQLYELDKLWMNTVEFYRARVSITIPFTRYPWTKREGKLPPEKLITRKKACMYIGIPEFWRDQIDAGYTCTAQPKTVSKSPWMEDYIHYNPSPF